MRSESALTSYGALKQALINEFANISSLAQIHEMLATRSCRQIEKLFAYKRYRNERFVIKEIAQRGTVDDTSVMHYVINIIPDTPNNKATLFGCHTLVEFENKLQTYQEICDQSSKFQQPKSLSTFNIPSRNQKDKATKIICFNCGFSDYLSNECTYKNQG